MCAHGCVYLCVWEHSRQGPRPCAVLSCSWGVTCLGTAPPPSRPRGTWSRGGLSRVLGHECLWGLAPGPLGSALEDLLTPRAQSSPAFPWVPPRPLTLTCISCMTPARSPLEPKRAEENQGLRPPCGFRELMRRIPWQPRRTCQALPPPRPHSPPHTHTRLWREASLPETCGVTALS